MLPEFGGIELMAIAALALIIIGPKDLPVMLRKLGKFVGKMRGMAQEFRASFDELARQSELDELRKEVEAMRLAQSYDPTGLVPGAYGPQSGYDAASEREAAGLVVEEPPALTRPKPRKPRTPKPAASESKPKIAAKPKAKPAAAPAAARKPKAARPAKSKTRAGTVQ